MIVAASTLACEPMPKSDALTVGDLASRPVIGRLGRPLGTVVEVEAEVVRGRDLRNKGDYGSYLLRVTSVDGADLPAPELLHFGLAPGSSARLAWEEFGLWRMKKGSDAGTLYPKDIDEIEQGYVGRHVRLLAYESGGYSGIPALNPRGEGAGVPIWQDHGFGFSTSLIVLREAEKK